MTTATFVIVGAGQAGATAAAELRRNGFDGRIVLIGDEPYAPYERPPLSKDVLLRPAETRCAIHPDDFYAQQRIELKLGVKATALDTDAHTLTLDDGETLAWDKLLLATGARVRRLPLLDSLGALGEGVYTLRTLDDARALQAVLTAGSRVAVVGAGVIGLELASSAVDLGAQVTVIEQAPLAMMRCSPPVLNEHLCAVHRARGVAIHLGVSVDSAVRANGAIALTLGDGTRIEADIVVYGIGVVPDTELAQRAGLAVDNGIETDARCATSHPDVYAAGDVASQRQDPAGRLLRRETWENANLQAATAARAMLGIEPDAPPVPWFWTDQCGLNVQFAGDVTAPEWIVRGHLDSPPAVLFGLDRDGTLIGGITINQGRDMRSLKDLIAGQARLARDELADPAFNLRNAAKALA